MRNSLFYGEIADKITDYLCKNPDHMMQIDRSISNSHDPGGTIWTVVSEAAYVFDNVEGLAEDEDINLINAVGEYSNEILDHLLVGDVPKPIQMVEMASRSIQTTM
ncbi:MAG: hypothetical protein R8G66_26045 [Cytophagales bacterium]|nr:hypothetical protein [Cytophagales bacterium]